MATKTRPASPLGPIPPNSNRRKDIEQMLMELGITEFEYVAQTPIKDINLEASLSNQARTKQIDDTVVTRYVTAWRKGDVFPPNIAYKQGRRLVLADGNHRTVSATKAEVEALDVYVIKAPAKTLQALTFLANTKHGLPTTPEERIKQALYLHGNGMSQEDAARQMGVSKTDVAKAYARQKADHRAASCGILPAKWDKLHQLQKNRINFIKTDEGFEALVDLAIRANLATDELRDIVSDINDASSSGNKQAQLIKDMESTYADRIADSGGGNLTVAKTRNQTPKTRILLALGQIRALPDDPAIIADQFAGPERKEAADQLRAQAKKLTALAAALS